MSEQVREMFSSIAPRYDLANEVLSFGVHRLWRRATIQASGAKAGQRVAREIDLFLKEVERSSSRP